MRGIGNRRIVHSVAEFKEPIEKESSMKSKLSVVLPFQQLVRAAFPAVNFHSCIPVARLLTHWRDDLKIRLFNGNKVTGY